MDPWVAYGERMMACMVLSHGHAAQAGRQQELIIDALNQAPVARSTDDDQLRRQESLSGKMVPLEERPQAPQTPRLSD